MRYDDSDQHAEYARTKNLESYDIEQKLKENKNIVLDNIIDQLYNQLVIIDDEIYEMKMETIKEPDKTDMKIDLIRTYNRIQKAINVLKGEE